MHCSFFAFYKASICVVFGNWLIGFDLCNNPICLLLIKKVVSLCFLTIMVLIIAAFIWSGTLLATVCFQILKDVTFFIAAFNCRLKALFLCDFFRIALCF
jgi:hypothetical protein